MSSSPFGAIVFTALVLGAGFAAAQGRAPSAEDVAAGASAIAGPFAIGTRVLDRNGEFVGRITRLTTADGGATLVMLRLGADSFPVPASRLRMRGDVAVSTLTKDELRTEGRQAEKGS